MSLPEPVKIPSCTLRDLIPKNYVAAILIEEKVEKLVSRWYANKHSFEVSMSMLWAQAIGEYIIMALGTSPDAVLLIDPVFQMKFGRTNILFKRDAKHRLQCKISFTFIFPLSVQLSAEHVAFFLDPFKRAAQDAGEEHTGVVGKCLTCARARSKTLYLFMSCAATDLYFDLILADIMAMRGLDGDTSYTEEKAIADLNTMFDHGSLKIAIKSTVLSGDDLTIQRMMLRTQYNLSRVPPVPDYTVNLNIGRRERSTFYSAVNHCCVPTPLLPPGA